MRKLSDKVIIISVLLVMAGLQNVFKDEKHNREQLKSGDIKAHIEKLFGKEKKPSLWAQLAQDKKTVNAAPKKQAAKSKNKDLEV